MQQLKEAIILAGGMGTRLRKTIPDLPKSMAPVEGRPFLSYVIDYLRMQGIEHFIFSLGFEAHKISDFLEKQYATLSYTTVIEEEPLGTGGAIRYCMEKVKSADVLVTNGDTLFKIDTLSLYTLHLLNHSECTLVLKPMHHFNRYGVVELEESGKIISFREKQYYQQGLINGGVYVLNREKFLAHSLPAKFSMEKDYLEKFCTKGAFYGSIQEGYFIDIGIPEDYHKAENDFKTKPLVFKEIDKSWSLFLDRDGVINVERKGEYVLNWEQFKFYEKALSSFKVFSAIFGRVFIVSNQRGVGKGLMSEEDLSLIHTKMLKEIEKNSGHVDKIFYCTEPDDACFFRKPNPGMAVKAKKEYSNIDFRKSIMVGNKPSDMRFGRAAGMYTVFISSTNPDQPFPHPDIDFCYPSISAFAEALQS